MKSRRNRRLVTALAIGALPVLALPIRAAVANSSPADPYFNFSVQPKGAIVAKGAAATVNLNITCFPEASSFFLQLSVTERVAGGRLATGFGGLNTQSLACDGFAHVVPVTVTANQNAFKVGTALVTTDSFACTPNGCASFHDEATISLK